MVPRDLCRIKQAGMQPNKLNSAHLTESNVE